VESVFVGDGINRREIKLDKKARPEIKVGLLT
jgi:hypothetical protein